jgi:hypothetical protein
MMRMFCPYCRKEGKPDPRFDSLEKAKNHLKGHGATKKELEYCEREWHNEMAVIRQMEREAMEAIL